MRPTSTSSGSRGGRGLPPGVKKKMTAAVVGTLILLTLTLALLYAMPELMDTFSRPGGSSSVARLRCRHVDAPCTKSTQCCTHFCDPHEQACKPADSVLTNPKWNPDCKVHGEACSQHTECCSLNCGSEGSCVQFQPAWGTSHSPECRHYGSPCSESYQCCSGHCSADTDTCADYEPECKATSQRCDSDEECCSFLCQDHACAECKESVTEVKDPKEAACTRNEECCSNMCKAGVCESCKGQGEPCGSNDDCCSMLCDSKAGVCEYHYYYDEYEGGALEAEGEQIPPSRYFSDEGGGPDPVQPQEAFLGQKYEGAKEGYVYRTGPLGMGYYLAHVQGEQQQHPQEQRKGV